MSDSELNFTIQTAVEAVVSDVTVREALDRPYTARVEVRVEDYDTAPDVFLGQDAVLEWRRESYGRQLTGLIRAVRSRGGDEEGAYFELEITPAFSLLALSTNTRMFQEQTVPEILETVLAEKLGPYSREVQLDLTAEYPKREYCLQYQESDFDFLSRLMEEEGISYSFDHQADIELLVLRDANASYGRVLDAADPLPHRPVRGDAQDDEEVLYSLDRAHRHTVTAVALRDFDFTSPSAALEEDVEGEDEQGRVRESYEHGWGRGLTIGDYSGEAYGANDGPRQVALRDEIHRSCAITAVGLGRCCGFVPGATFEITGHPALGTDGEYLITAVTHRREPVPGGQSERYHNEFECIPLDTEHRPARKTPKPRITSVQTAIVTGPGGEEIHTDEHARITVQFPWDRENEADETSSCWIRVQQKWAGSGWGFVWLPRIGMEVIVEFIDGDPDRPVVTGSLYDGEHPTPYALPDEKSKSTIKSASTPGGDGFNEWRFEDKAGEEEVFTHAQKDYNEVVENDHNTDVGNDQTIQVDNNQTQTIHANQVEDVGANQSLTVDGNRTVHVESDFDETVDGTETRTVTGAVTETFDATETRTIGAALTETFSASETRSISGDQTETIAAAREVTIGADSTVTVSAALTETVAGSVTESIGGNWDITAAGGLTIVTPGSMNLTLTGGLTLAATGGVNQVDSHLATSKGKHHSVGALSIGAVGFKDEVHGVHLAYTARKSGGCGADIPSRGLDIKVCFMGDEKGTAEVKFNGAEIGKYGAQSE